MAIKISGFYDEIDSNLDVQLNAISEFGEHFMCPRTIDGKNIADYTADEFQNTIMPRLKEKGVGFSSIGSPIGKVKLDDEEGYQKQLKQLAELVKICKLMDCKYIRIFSFFVDPKGDYDAYLPKVVNKLKGYLDVVGDSGVVLLHENEKKIYGDVPERVLKIHNAISDKRLGFAYDASNFIQCKADPVKAYEMLKDIICYYHIKDCSAEGVEVPLGMGEGHYKEMLADLCARGYDGFFTLEPHTAKYAVLKKTVYVLAPIMSLIKPTKYFYRVFRRIDKVMNISAFKKVSRKQVFIWQYENLKKLLTDVGFKED